MSPDDPPGRSGPDAVPGPAYELESWDDFAPGERHSLVELVNRVLDRGVVISGDVTISVAGVDLVYLSLNALLTSVSTARRLIDGRLGTAPGRAGPPVEE